MRKRRMRFPENISYQHLMSRTINGEALFGNREKEVLRKMIWQVADFSGIRIITYAVMKNHFHLLVEIPPQDTAVSDEELVRRFRVLYPRPMPWQPMTAEVLEQHLKSGSIEGDQLRKSLTKRMHDGSIMMKTLKQRFTRWFNHTRDRFGPLWCERFKSVLVEGDRWALRTVAAYIDLNPVRAGIVDDPKDYRFSGYGEAVAGGKSARAGLSIVDRDLAGYRQTLYGYGSEPAEGKASFSRETALQVLRTERGEISLAAALRCRIRYFTDGKILGSSEFVDQHLQPQETEGKRSHPHPMSGSLWMGLAVARGIRKDLFS